MNTKDALYDYVFHYNHIGEFWSAIPRDKYSEYWNGQDVEGVIKSKDYNIIIELLLKGTEYIKSIK